VYRLGDLRTGDRVTVARLVDDAQMPGLATDADVLAASAGVVVRTYGAAHVYALPDWELVESIELPEQRQGETVAVIDGGPGFYVGSEGVPSPLHAMRVAPRAWRELNRRAEAITGETPPSPGDATRRDDAPAADEDEDDPGPARPGGRRRLVVLAVVGAIALVAAVRAVLRRR
jgi:hypothetical protein